MSKKITDLEGRLDAAFARSDKAQAARPWVIGRYSMQNRNGMVPAFIVFCKVVDDDKTEYVTWESKATDPTFKWGGHYFPTFLEGLKDFLRRIETDGGVLTQRRQFEDGKYFCDHCAESSPVEYCSHCGKDL